MKTYSTPELVDLTGRHLHSVERWLQGKNSQGLRLKSTRDERGRHRVTEKDLKDFLLKLNLPDKKM